MQTEQALAAGREGFTLVEVLAAMLILAVGLLGLEALGVTAARSLVRAGELGEYTALAADRIEQETARIRAGLAAEGTSRSATADGDSIKVVVSRDQVGATAVYLWRVDVTVTPSATAGGGVAGDLGPVQMTAHAVK
ncbi:MAG TPA: prepilin-type N-terminal cleavage/methylation domain-containing protein [Longimicrobium sp.]|nr:prepilin-type N-terminal cleavage/methylation domain-containing protein [Longimicrobium sp.]